LLDHLQFSIAGEGKLIVQVEMGRARHLCLGKTPHTTFDHGPGSTPSQSLAPLVPQHAEPHGGKEETINCRCLIFPITSKPGIDLSVTHPMDQFGFSIFQSAVYNNSTKQMPANSEWFRQGRHSK
jgi:hypothetical protein